MRGRRWCDVREREGVTCKPGPSQVVSPLPLPSLTGWVDKAVLLPLVKAVFSYQLRENEIKGFLTSPSLKAMVSTTPPTTPHHITPHHTTLRPKILSTTPHCMHHADCPHYATHHKLHLKHHIKHDPTPPVVCCHHYGIPVQGFCWLSPDSHCT